MRTLILALFASLRAGLMTRTTLALENAALRQQRAVYLRTQKHVRLRPEDRIFWVVLRRLWPDWTRALVIVKPETVLAWHRRGFVIMEIGSRRIVHVNVTTNPTLSWVKQQVREATTEHRTPRFLVHGNDGIFGQYGRRVTVEQDIGTRSYRVVAEYVRHYNGGRPSQAIHGIPDPYPELNQPPLRNGKRVCLPVLGGLLHDYRLVA